MVRRGALALGLCAALAACPGSLGDVDVYLDAGRSGGCDAPTLVFEPYCDQCHSAGAANLGALDLTSPDVASRLVNVDAQLCAGQILVTAGDLDASFLFQKVTWARPTCGTQMPQSGSLGQTEIACIAAWITALAPRE